MSKENCYEVYVCRVDSEIVYIGSSRMKKLFIEWLDSDDWCIIDNKKPTNYGRFSF